jgi:hypothetical protein
MLQCVVVCYLNCKFISHNFKVKIHKYFEIFFVRKKGCVVNSFLAVSVELQKNFATITKKT